MKLRHLPVNRLSLRFAVALAALLAGHSASATDFAWDPLDDTNGGNGTWDVSGFYWDSGTTPTAANGNTPWVNGAANNAYFGGSPGIVTLGTGITAGSLNFSTTGYQITLGGNSLTLNAANTGNAVTLNLNSTGNLILKNDGDGTGGLQIVNFLENVVVSNSDTITVGKLGTTGNAANKTLQLGDLGIGGQTLTVTPSNGFGLEFTGNTTLTGAATFSVGTATASNVIKGLTLSGPVSGGFGLTKSGVGTLVLGSASNTFGTGGSIIDITDGILQVASNGALGDSANVVRLSANSATKGLRLAGGTAASPTAYTLTGRAITLNAAASGIDVTGYTAATIDTAFGFSAAANTLQKNDNGVLTFASGVDNSGLTGTWTISAGAIQIAGANNLNASASALTVTNAVGAALQLTNGVTLNKAGTLTINSSGLNSAGSLQSVGAFTNTVSSLITLGSASTIGADTGSTLNLSGGISGAFGLTFNTAGTGAIRISGTAISANVTPITKIGSGTLTFDVNSNLVVAPINVNAGTLDIKTGVLGGTGVVTVHPGASLNLTSTTANRLGGRPLTLNGGILNVSGAANETTGLLTINSGQSIINNTSGATLVLGAATPTRSVGGTTLFKGGSTTNFAVLPTFIGVTTAGGTATTQGVLPWAIFDAGGGLGTSFVTTNATTPFTARALLAAEMSAGNAFTSGSNVLLSGASSAIAANTSINSLTSNTTSGVTINSPSLAAPTTVTLTVSSGGILSTAATNSISGGVLAVSNGIIFTPGADKDANVLTISSAVTGTTLTKAGAGTLVLSSTNGAYAGYTANNFAGGNHSGGFFINEGVVQLGANNALYCGSFNDANSLTVNAGGTLDLNGKTQFVGALYGQVFNSTAMNAPGVASGTITSFTGSGNLILVGGNPGGGGPFSFGGSITGTNVGFASKMQYASSSGWAELLLGANTYGGPTLIYGGGTYLKDDGTISGTSDVSLNYGILYLDNTGLSNNNDRLKNLANISMSGGTLSFLGRAQTASTETVGGINLVQGVSTIGVTTGGTGVNSADLTVDSIARTAGSGATLAFSLSGTAGSIGSGNGRVNINSPATFTAAMVNGIVPWAAVGGHLATYIPYTTANGVSSGGIGALGTTGYTAYDSTATTYNGVNQPTWNAYAGGGTTITGSVTLNSLGVNGTTLNFTNPGDTINVVSGGLLVNGNVNTIGASLDSGRITAGGTTGSGTVDLYLWSGSSNNNTNILNSRIVDNGSGASTRLVLTFRGDGNRSLTMNNGSNSYTGGTILNTSANLNATSGVVIPNDLSGLTGLVINGTSTTTAVTMNNSAGQIGSGNMVTLNGGSTLSLFLNNTLAGLVLNNTGGGSPTVNSGGVLTLNSGVTTTSNNINGTATLNGRVILPSSSTLSVGAATFNGQIINPLFADLIATGLAGGGGTTTKVGLGVMQFNQPTVLTGTLDVTAGGIQTGGTNAGSRLLDVVLENGTWLNLNGFDGLFGSLATPASGTGMVTNSGALKTLTVGFDGASTNFSGAFTRYNDTTVNLINLTKIGGGTMTLLGNSSTASGTLTVSGGGITFLDSGTNNFISGAVAVNQGGTLTLDDSGAANLSTRLGNVGVTLSGGNFVSTAATAGSTETTTGTLTFSSGESTVTVNPGATSNVTTFGGLAQNAGSSWTVAGTGIGTAIDKLMLTGQANGTVYFRGAVGNEFAVYDTTLGVKAYTGYTTNANINSASGSNFKLDATTTTRNLTAALSLATLDIADNNATVGTNGSLLPTQGLTLSSAAVLVNGSNAAISTPVLALGAEGVFRVNGSNTLTLNSRLTGGAALTKTGSGTLVIAKAANQTGTTYVNQGTLTLGSGQANTLPVLPTATTPTLAALTLNGGALDLSGQSQAVGSLSNNNANSGIGGSVINSGALATFTSAATGNTTFAGQIGGGTDASPVNNALNFIKSGANTLTLTSPNTYSGTTTVRGGGGLALKDGGTLLSTSTAAINVIYGTLTADQSGLNPVGNLNPTRISATAPVTLSGGGKLALSGGNSVDSTLTLNSVTTATGTNLLSVTTPFVSTVTGGGTATLNIGSLVQGSTSGAIRFTPPQNVKGLGQGGSGSVKIIISNITPFGGGSVATETQLVNGLLPGWMNVITSTDNGGNLIYDFAGYLATATASGAQGVGALGSSGFQAYDTNVLVANATATQNLFMYNNAGNPAQTAVTTRTLNSINYSRDWGWSMASQTDTLTIGSGSFMNEYSGQVGSMNINGGKINSGVGALYMNVYDNSIILNSSVTDNGATPVALVKQGSANLTLDPRVNIYNNNTSLYLSGVNSFNLGTMSTAAALFAGMGVSGTGIQAGTTITSVAGTTVTLSLNTNAQSVAGNLTFTAPTAVTTTDGSSTVTMGATSFVPTVGMTVTGPGTTPGTRITNVAGAAGAYTLTLSNTVPAGTPTLSYGAQSNSYTGGTFINEGVLTFPALSTQMLPGDVTINGSTAATALTTTAAGQLAATANVTINGGGTLTMSGTNTLASLTFDNIGTTATVAGATSLTLSAANAITATNDNLTITPSITGTALVLSNAAPVINVAGVSPDGLTITAPITSAGGAITKTGAGSLVLPAANSFTTGVNLNGGTLIVDNNTALGSGTLAIADGTALMSGTGVRTLNNLVSVAGNFTFGALTPAYGTAVANNGVTLGNTTTLAAGPHQITVDGLLNVSTISGQLTGGTNLTKAGPGTLVLNNAANDFGGSVSINGGTLQQNVAGAVPSGRIMNVAADAAFNMNGISESLDSLNGAGSVINPGAAAVLTINGSTNGSFSGTLAATTAANLSLVKDGANTQALSGTNPYGGTTTVTAGTLLVNGANTGGGAVTVGASGTLGGTGSIAGAVNVTGVLSPGASIGVLTSGAVTFANNSTYQYQVNSSVSPTVGADLQIVNGALNLGGTVTLTLTDIGAGTIAGGTVFSLFNYSTGLWNSGLFTYNSTVLADDSTFNFLGKDWTIDYNATAKGANVAGAQAGNYVNITASGADAYTTWIQTPAFGIPGGQQGPNDDPDNDGATNLDEFAFGGIPNDPTQRGLVFGLQADSNDPGTAKEMILTIAVRTGVAFSTPGGPALSDATVDGLNYAIQGSTDLTNWTVVVTPVPVINPGLPTLPANYQYVSFSLNGSDGLPGKGFLRAQVVKP